MVWTDVLIWPRLRFEGMNFEMIHARSIWLSSLGRPLGHGAYTCRFAFRRCASRPNSTAGSGSGSALGFYRLLFILSRQLKRTGANHSGGKTYQLYFGSISNFSSRHQLPVHARRVCQCGSQLLSFNALPVTGSYLLVRAAVARSSDQTDPHIGPYRCTSITSNKGKSFSLSPPSFGPSDASSPFPSSALLRKDLVISRRATKRERGLRSTL